MRFSNTKMYHLLRWQLGHDCRDEFNFTIADVLVNLDNLWIYKINIHND
jgi:hypothetical protein